MTNAVFPAVCPSCGQTARITRDGARCPGCGARWTGRKWTFERGFFMELPEPTIDNFFKCDTCSKTAKRQVMVDKFYGRRVEKNFLNEAAGWKCPNGHLVKDEEAS